MRRRWPKNTAGRKIRQWGGHATGGQVPVYGSVGVKWTLCYKQTHTVDQTHIQFRPASGLRQRRSCVSHGAPILLRQPASQPRHRVHMQSAKRSTSQPEPPAPSGRRDLQFLSCPVLNVPDTDRTSIRRKVIA